MLTFNLDERSVIALNHMFDDSINSIDKNIFVPFRDFSYGMNNAFLICHGTINGTIILSTHDNNREYSSEEILSMLWKHLNNDGIHYLYVICCYAGLLPNITIKGITIKGVCLDKKPISIVYNKKSQQKHNKATIICDYPVINIVA